MQEITSASNPRIKLARKLLRRRTREQIGLCLLEGQRLVEDALSSGAQFECVFVTRQFVAQGEQSDLIGAFDNAGTPVLIVDNSLLAAISDTMTPQGIVALVYIPVSGSPNRPHLVLILDGIGDPGNAGTLLRSAVGAGVEMTIFGPGTVDAFSPKVLRAGMGAHFRTVVQSIARWTGIIEHIGTDRRFYVADGQAKMGYEDVDWRQPSALIVGSEAHGPSREAREAATAIAIPLQGSIESLNAAVAGSVILFEAARQRRDRHN